MEELKKYLLKSSKLSVELTNAGAAVVSVKLKDKNGFERDVVLGYDELERYLKNSVYFGAVIGRFAGEIRPAGFVWEGRRRELETAGKVHLHGGPGCISFKRWQAAALDGEVRFSFLSQEGESGYPGDVFFSAVYRIEHEDTLVLEYTAESETLTPVNMTAHSYFNLNGHKAGSLAGHILYIDAERYNLTDAESLACAQTYPVRGSSYDFSSFRGLERARCDCNYRLRKKGNVRRHAVFEPKRHICTARVHSAVPTALYGVRDARDGQGRSGLRA